MQIDAKFILLIIIHELILYASLMQFICGKFKSNANIYNLH